MNTFLGSKQPGAALGAVGAVGLAAAAVSTRAGRRGTLESLCGVGSCCWSLAKVRLEEVLKSFTEHTKRCGCFAQERQ